MTLQTNIQQTFIVHSHFTIHAPTRNHLDIANTSTVSLFPA